MKQIKKTKKVIHRKNLDNVVEQAVSLEEEVLQRDREIVRLKRDKKTLERENRHIVTAKAEVIVESDARVLKYKIATVISAVVAVVMVFERIA